MNNTTTKCQWILILTSYEIFPFLTNEYIYIDMMKCTEFCLWIFFMPIKVERYVIFLHYSNIYIYMFVCVLADNIYVDKYIFVYFSCKVQNESIYN